LRLACAEPGDQLAIFGEALRELSERATYLYEEGGRYWFSTTPTLNRVADDRAKALPDHEVDAAIVHIIRDDANTKGGFQKVFAGPDDPVAIDEATALSLVVLVVVVVDGDDGGHRQDVMPMMMPGMMSGMMSAACRSAEGTDSEV
jgi:hypothetical protein